ncbi:MAG: FAD-dependent oxidoreductase [Ornithinimicrobium sp.]
MRRDADVVIIGAGLSGLIAAREVLAAGYEPVMLEANDRVGGRILTQDVGGVPLELGAQWIGDTHHRMQSLATELGIEIFDQFDSGQTSYELTDEVLRENVFRERHAHELIGIERVLRLLDEMAATVPVEAPWLAPQADVWDRLTVGQWFDAQGLGPVARELLEICTVGILAVPTVEVSLLCLLQNLQVCGVTAELLAESEGGAQTKRFVGGTSLIPQRLAAALGERVILDAPALTVDYSADQVTVTCRGGLVATGRRLVVALSPTLAGRLMYDPPLPGVRDQMTQRVPQASAHKMFALYDEPFWRDEGLNGQLISSAGPARMSNDSCLPEGGGPGILLAFLEGESARVAGRWSTADRHDALRAELGRHFGPRGGVPTQIVERGWAEEQWTRGCYNSNFGPCGLLHFADALSRPIGPITWAATETATAWAGYMEGAVQAGQRAARESLASLDRHNPLNPKESS